MEHLNRISRHYKFSKDVYKSLAYQNPPPKNSLTQEARFICLVSAFLSGISNPAELLCSTQNQQHWGRNPIKVSRHKPPKTNTRMADLSLTCPALQSIHTAPLTSNLSYSARSFLSLNKTLNYLFKRGQRATKVGELLLHRIIKVRKDLRDHQAQPLTFDCTWGKTQPDKHA